MTFYESELNKIKSTLYADQFQLNVVIGTRNYIADNYDSVLSLDVLSHASFVSKYHLLRLFKKYYGQTPKQYLTDTRIERSMEYLKRGTSITETCFAIGFGSPCSFSTLFKSRMGLTPTEFQKSNFHKAG